MIVIYSNIGQYDEVSKHILYKTLENAKQLRNLIKKENNITQIYRVILFMRAFYREKM